MKKKGIILAGVIVVILGGIIGKQVIEKTKEAHDNSVVEFVDETMGRVLCNACYWSDNITLKNVTYKDLKNIYNLRTGYIGYYDTLMDLQYCTRLTTLSVNGAIGKNDAAYFINRGEPNKKVSEHEIEKAQRELEKLLPKLKNLKKLVITSEGEEEWTSIEYMKNIDNIESFSIGGCKATDYSVLKTCKSLKEIEILSSELSKAEDLIGIENLESISIYRTPLVKDEKEMKKLKEAYPDADIYYESSE